MPTYLRNLVSKRARFIQTRIRYPAFLPIYLPGQGWNEILLHEIGFGRARPIQRNVNDESSHGEFFMEERVRGTAVRGQMCLLGQGLHCRGDLLLFADISVGEQLQSRVQSDDGTAETVQGAITRKIARNE